MFVPLAQLYRRESHAYELSLDGDANCYSVSEISCHRQRITTSVWIAPDARVYMVHTALLIKRKPSAFSASTALSARFLNDGAIPGLQPTASKFG